MVHEKSAFLFIVEKGETAYIEITRSIGRYDQAI